MRGRRRSGAGKEFRTFVVSAAFILAVFWLWRSGVIESFLTRVFVEAFDSSLP